VTRGSEAPYFVIREVVVAKSTRVLPLNLAAIADKESVLDRIL
jgi:hypothetical protein